MDVKVLKQLCAGRWFGILSTLGISVNENGKHTPCPICGGKDRFKMDKDGAAYFCNQGNPQAGDTISLIQKYLGNPPFQETIKRIQEIIGYSDHQSLPTPKQPPTKNNTYTTQQRWNDIINGKNLNMSPVYRLLCKRRSISKEVVLKAFNDNKLRFIKHHLDKYEELSSVAFPYTTLNDKKEVLAVQCLSVDGESYSDEKEKNKVFTANSKAKEDCFFQIGIDIEKTKTIILCEAVINALSCIECYPESRVLALGSANATNKVKALRPYRDKGSQIICFFDNDEDGRKATEAVAIILGEKAKHIQWPTDTPNKYDINDLLKAGKQKTIIKMINNAEFIEINKADTEEAIEDATEDAIDELNKQFGMIVVKSKTRIIYQQEEDRTDREKEFLPAYEPHYLTGYDFKLLLKNRRIPNPDYSPGNKGVPKLIDLADAWLKHPRRQIFNRVIFEPGADRPGCKNLYQGLGCKPAKGDWSLYKTHVKRNICNGDMYYYEWVMAWLARIVQTPGGEKPGTAIVLKGKKGTGKDVFMKPFSRIFEQNYVMVTKPSQVTGVFNNHLRYCIVLFVNEAWSSKDRKADGVFKSIITEEDTMIEPKGIDAFPVKSYVNCVVASNEKLIVNVGDSERRYLVMKVNERHIQDHPYFAAIDNQMYKEDGVSALLYHLMYEVDVTKHNLRRAPYTTETFEQRRQTLDPFAAFWFDILINDEWHGWEDGIVKKDFYQEYINFCDVIKTFDRLKGSGLFGKELRKYCEVGETSRPHGQPRAYSFPEKNECRQQFADKIGLPVSWGKYEDSPKNSVNDI